MDESVMPEWMKQAKQATDLRESMAVNADQERKIAQMKVQYEGPAFWKDLTEKLAIQTDFLPNVYKEISGRADVSDCSNGELRCHVEVSLHGLLPKSAHIDLFYRPGGSIVRGGGFLGVVEGKVSLSLFGECCNNPEQAASRIIKELVRKVKPEAITK